jgi:hypothetical protein
VDSTVGITLIGIGLLLRRRTNKHRLTAEFAPVSEEDSIPGAEKR